jgi:uncharacterized protein YabE (DUF348 family)
VACLALAAAAMLYLTRGYGTPVTLTVDGYTEQLRSTRHDVSGLLSDLGLSVRPEDSVAPAASTPLAHGLHITLIRARQALIAADGETRQVYSRARTVGELLGDAGVRLDPNDEVWLEGGQQVTPTTPLPASPPPGPPRFARPRPWTGHEPEPVRLSVRRAVPITVEDGSAPYTIETTAATVGEALLREQVTLYLGDNVIPSLGSQVRDGMRVVIQRSKAVLVTADGRSILTRTRGQTVGDALAELGIMVASSDRVEPAMGEPVLDDLRIQVTRVRETVQVERQSIPFESILVPDDDLEIDHQEERQTGQEGEFRRRWQIVTEDGVQRSQVELDAWVASEPVTQVIAYGRKIVSRPLPIPGSTSTYWRDVHMLATSYSRSTAGVSSLNPDFGRTRLGLPMGKGLVAVDPSVIPLGTQLYIPGYGMALAADTGSAVLARRIDLGYNDNDLQLWHRWVDVYVLDPPPPSWEIRYVLPDWPPQ